ncbi:hypothetical protein DL766_007231 [Monosporascus sp. MC13-8B]|uniref:Uncharacterized protein n=1 Tax=Monosporascus cannonballus TaxID=155416 RepID=A0ABY0HNQ3_9PEZI|nr:hypothetical protein DL762_000286 [Monosporascus cannonballus]RYP24648.1 hypothetical protein DL766_007231 [Monosporascus sp. MC13-8B]
MAADVPPAGADPPTVTLGYPKTLNDLLSEASALPYADKHRNYTELPYSPPRNAINIDRLLEVLRRMGENGRRAVEPLGLIYGHAIGRGLRIPNFRAYELGQPALRTQQKVQQRSVIRHIRTRALRYIRHV